MKPDLLPMLCGRSYQEVPNGFEHAEAKLDGWRAIVHVNGDIRVYGGRNGSDYSGRVPYLEDALRHLPPDTALDGELVSPGNWGMVQSIMTTLRPHQPSIGSPPLRLYVFDMLRLNGYDTRHMAWAQRRKLVEAIPVSDLLRVTPLVPATPKALESALKVGFEGLVLKTPESRYVSGSRSPDWIKVKPQLTTEARITGFKPGKAGGAYEGMVGAFRIELLENGARTTVKCGTDERHQEATEHPMQWLGAIIEIRHHGLSKDGIPRHPQFSRRRADLE
jgi:bifunctional non-homologous end joining protein LigD